MVSGSVSVLHCILPSTNNHDMHIIYGELITLKRKWRLSLGISLIWGKEWHPAHQEACSPALTPAVPLSCVFPLRVLLLLPHIRTVRFPGRANILHLNKENVSLCCCLLFHYSLLFSCLKLLYFPSLFFSFLSLPFFWDGSSPPPPCPPPWLFSFSRSVSAYFLPHYLSTCKLAMCWGGSNFFFFKLVKMHQRQIWRILPLLDSSWF